MRQTQGDVEIYSFWLIMKNRMLNRKQVRSAKTCETFKGRNYLDMNDKGG